MKWKLKLATVLFLTLALFASSASAATKYVRSGGTGDGSSWASAMGAAQLASFLKSHTDHTAVEVWVAAGTYSLGNTIVDTFRLNKGVKLYGGFPATGNPTKDDRDPKVHVTTLDGGKMRRGSAWL